MASSASSIIIAIDGPSASGKSTVSQRVADVLGYLHVDTGSMYRAFTWKVLEEKMDPHDASAIINLMKRVHYECDFVERDNGPAQLRNHFDGVDPGPAIREPCVEESASVVASIPQVREWLVEKQRQLACHGNLVAEGRDIGTVVFPDTPFKFYLDADPEVRARRRAADQTALGTKAEVKMVGQAMAKRDRRDRTRSVAPLKVAHDAIRIDTSTHTIEDTADVILKHIRSKHLAAG